MLVNFAMPNPVDQASPYEAPPQRFLPTAKGPTSQIGDIVVSDSVVLFFLLPEGQILLEKLDDALGVTEVILLQLVNPV